MDSKLISNWNRVVGKNDLVYYLGDFAMHNVKYYLKRLNGTIIFILGNHDGSLIRDHIHPVTKRHIIYYKGEPILLIHNPKEKTLNGNPWVGWCIHGHTHNHELEEFPKVNYKKKTINVSCELHNYTPIELFNLIKMR